MPLAEAPLAVSAQAAEIRMDDFGREVEAQILKRSRAPWKM